MFSDSRDRLGIFNRNYFSKRPSESAEMRISCGSSNLLLPRLIHLVDETRFELSRLRRLVYFNGKL
jgi:hypothetical protein